VLVSVLGPVRLEVGGAVVDVPGTKRRAVLALLAMAAPDAITTDRLVDAIWPGQAPRSGRSALQSHVSRLRRHLGEHGDRLENAGFGYRLALEPDELDAWVAARLVDEARHAAPGDPAAARLRAARGMWRGRPLSDVDEVPDLDAWAQALDDLWADASELLVECALASGGATDAATVAAEVVATHPLREDAAVLLVRALAAKGRTAEALREAHAFRRRLADETGLEPSPALAEVEHRVAAGEVRASPHAASRGDGARPVTVVDAGARPVTDRTATAPAGRIVGREAELAGVIRLLRSERLVTVVGPGGVGKTRLAFEIAGRADHDAEVTVVRLAPVTDGRAVPAVVARALGLRAEAGDTVERCALRLRTGRHLLVLDNCEHVLAPVRELCAVLVDACPDLTVLATSRERMAVPVEQICRVAPLPLPDLDDLDAARDGAAITLFADQARRVRPAFGLDDDLAAVARIIRAVDGLPLAIELVAGRLASMTVGDVAARLDRALDVVGRGRAPAAGADGRHRTLRAAIAWSYDLLPDDEQRLFRHLAVFADGFDLATAETVARDLDVTGDPVALLAHLVDASMVVADLDLPRYRMLDSLRHFGLDRLADDGELGEASARLRRWAVELARWFETAAESEDEVAADARLRRELGNLQAAWIDARTAGDLDAAIDLPVRLYWGGGWRELAELWQWALDTATEDHLVGHPQQAALLAVAAEGAWFSAGDLDLAESLARRADDLATPDDQPGWSISRAALSDVALFRGRFDEARELSIESGHGTRWKAERYVQAALAAGYAGDLAAARELVATAQDAVESPTLRAWTRYVEGELDGLTGEWVPAEAAYRDAIEGATRTGASFIVGVASVGLVSALVAQDRIDEALDGYRVLLDHWERTGGWTQQWTTLRNLADLLDLLGDGATAATLRAAADAAPEAPVVAPDPAPAGDPAPAVDPSAAAAAIPGRGRVLDLARTAIADALAVRR
jgi:predicted ATPase/DNA-binding SARP family transcriptional activator